MACYLFITSPFTFLYFCSCPVYFLCVVGTCSQEERGKLRPDEFKACLISLGHLGNDKQVLLINMTSNSWPHNIYMDIYAFPDSWPQYIYIWIYICIPWAAECSSDVPLLCFCLWLCAVSLCVHLWFSVLGAVSFPTLHCFIIPTMSLHHPCTLDLCPLTFPIQKKNGAMDSDDFRACLISMGYDLVGP